MNASHMTRTASAATTVVSPLGVLAACRRARATVCRASDARLRCGKLLAAAALLLSGTAGWAAESVGAYDGALTITLENDVFTGSDNNYTNGLGVSWVSNEISTFDERSPVHRWAKFWSFLPFVGDQGSRTYVAWSIAQEMHTPDDIDNPNPPIDDQPYAGVLYLDSVIYAKKERWAHAWQLRVGLVGPASQADDVQRWFHGASGSNKPLGWSTQLPNEPVVNVGYTGSYLLAGGDLGGSASWRLIPVANVGLGNYFTGAGLGLYGEVGWNLVDAMGGTALRQGFNAASTVGVGPVKGWSVSLSGGISGYGVVHYLPLDGTVFKDSRSVDSEPFVGMGTLGLSVRHKDFVFFLGRTYFTKTFETERRRPEFGTMSLSWFF
jgi:lipid A 3-O-deacylase